jgi:glutamyl-tRNA synthetase
MNGQYIMALAPQAVVGLARPRLEQLGLWRPAFDGAERPWLAKLVALLQPRSRTLLQLAELAVPYLVDDEALDYEAKAARKHLKGETLVQDLTELSERLAATEPWEHEPLERELRTLAERRGVSAGKVIHPLRLALTGRGASPGIFDVLELLGRERTLGRLRRLVERVESGALPRPDAPARS